MICGSLIQWQNMTSITKKHYYLLTGGAIVLILAVVFQLFYDGTFQNKIIDKTEKVPFRVQTFSVDGKGWGYEIVCKNKIIIKQDIIPAIQHPTPFQSEEDARETGQLVINKMKRKKLPSVSIAELDSMQIEGVNSLVTN